MFNQQLAHKFSKSLSNVGAGSSRIVHHVNPHWMNLILYGLNGDMGMQLRRYKQIFYTQMNGLT
jgi:hypothetical protein